MPGSHTSIPFQAMDDRNEAPSPATSRVASRDASPRASPHTELPTSVANSLARLNLDDNTDSPETDPAHVLTPTDSPSQTSTNNSRSAVTSNSSARPFLSPSSFPAFYHTPTSPVRALVCIVYQYSDSFINWLLGVATSAGATDIAPCYDQLEPTLMISFSDVEAANLMTRTIWETRGVRRHVVDLGRVEDMGKIESFLATRSQPAHNGTSQTLRDFSSSTTLSTPLSPQDGFLQTSSNARAPFWVPNRRANEFNAEAGAYTSNGANGVNGVNGVNGINGERRATVPQFPNSTYGIASPLTDPSSVQYSSHSFPPSSIHATPTMNGAGPFQAYQDNYPNRPPQAYQNNHQNRNHRARADQNPPCNTLYVGNIPMTATEEHLRDLFSKVPGYRRLIFRSKDNGPMSFVEFESIQFASKALSSMHGAMLPGSRSGIRLSFSKNPLGVKITQPPAPTPINTHANYTNGQQFRLPNILSYPPPGLPQPTRGPPGLAPPGLAAPGPSNFASSGSSGFAPSSPATLAPSGPSSFASSSSSGFPPSGTAGLASSSAATLTPSGSAGYAPPGPRSRQGTNHYSSSADAGNNQYYTTSTEDANYQFYSHYAAATYNTPNGNASSHVPNFPRTTDNRWTPVADWTSSQERR